MDYQEFLKSKHQKAQSFGFEPGAMNPMLKDFQASIVRWALKGGCRAIFAGTGLGKTITQLEWARHVSDEKGPVLILAPLAVAEQTAREAAYRGPDMAGAWAGLCDWLMEECLILQALRGLSVANHAQTTGRGAA